MEAIGTFLFARGNRAFRKSSLSRTPAAMRALAFSKWVWGLRFAVEAILELGVPGSLGVKSLGFADLGIVASNLPGVHCNA